MSKPLAGKKARDVMRQDYISVEPTVTVLEAAQLMDGRNKGGCVVQDAISDVVGVLTERDLLRRVVAKAVNPATTPVSEVMTKSVVVAQANDDAWELLSVMLQENFRTLPVVDGRTMVGMISLKGFCRALFEDLR